MDRKKHRDGVSFQAERAFPECLKDGRFQKFQRNIMADKAAAFRVRTTLERRSVGGGKQKALTGAAADKPAEE